MELAGYDTGAFLGTGSVGEVWRAQTSAGETVALKRLTCPVDVEVLRGEADRWRGLDTPYAVALRAVELHGDRPVLVLDYIGGGSLGDLLARRQLLGPGEVVALGVPLAEALAAAHTAGIVHGNVSAANVLLTEGGLPRLADLGVRQLLAGPATAAPEADVAALGSLLQQAMIGCYETAPQVLVDAVAAASAPLPDRPTAAGLADLLRASCPAAPLLRRDPGPITGAAPSPPSAVHSAGSPARRTGALRSLSVSSALSTRAVVAAGAVVVLVLAAGVGWASGRGGPAPVPLPPRAESPGDKAVGVPAPAARPDWRKELDRLDAARAVAFAAADPALLAAVDAPGSPALAADRATLASLKAKGLAADGVRHHLIEVTAVLQSADKVTLRVLDERAPVSTVDASGQVVATLPARTRATYDVELVKVSGAWRLARVTPRLG